MSSVGLFYDAYSPDLQVQILRDLVLLDLEFDGAFTVYDDKGLVPKEVFDSLNIRKDGSPPELAVRYKVGEAWPKVPRGVEVVDRDLTPKQSESNIDPNVKPGYYLREQGRTGSSLTERYLSRSAPRGKGVVDNLVLLLWCVG